MPHPKCPRLVPGLCLLLTILLLAGCQPTAPASAIAQNVVQNELPTAVASPTLAQPVNPPVVFTVAPEPTATFTLPTVTPIPTVTAVFSNTLPTPDPATVAETATPQPTFT
ncbi:MAG: hypothetical protein KDE56_16070, partial [Anaerolineales bacterium]|nr:hypothetical protein [Anaerolineales bacterium]